ncbi:DUF3054 domain-containing protein [Rhodococcus tibetensis]|uniref:DUF3054 domain-containing protein n=1 Tax=Rhodococcus tibetensis TaxID=2965064 RepID=A0ABT1QGR5_9NOCA|nr:DUF3054 domain-containing protein [Rhodococcus sp. FXJ9.536]MCQ4121479.1 DUF3054 domain-containing protein [Rhodococcus sp. FXJ9.536]
MKKFLPALVLDVVLVVVFCAIGRRSHDEANALTGLVTTAWPFLSGLAVGWIATVALYRDKFDAFLIVPTGLLVWFSTLVVGMLLRVVSGQGTAFSFILVAATVLAVFLLGWRAALRAIAKVRTHS